MAGTRSFSIAWTSASTRPVRSGWCHPVPPGLLVVTASLSPALCRVTASGELTELTVPILDGAVEDVGSPRPATVRLDLTGLTHLDDAGLAGLRRADRLVRQGGSGLVVAPPVGAEPGRLVAAAVVLGRLGPAFGAE